MMKIEIDDHANLVRQSLEKLEPIARIAARDRALRPAAKPAMSKLKALTPRSDPEAKRKQSRTSRTKWQGAKPLHTVVRTKITRGNTAGAVSALVGYRHPDGNLANIRILGPTHKTKRRRVFYWGTDQNRSEPKLQLLRMAIQATSRQVASAFVRAINREVTAQIRKQIHDRNVRG